MYGNHKNQEVKRANSVKRVSRVRHSHHHLGLLLGILLIAGSACMGYIAVIGALCLAFVVIAYTLVSYLM